MFCPCSKSDFVAYFLRTLKVPFSRRRYFILSPPFMKNLKILDKKKKIIISMNVESVSDYWTVAQVFHDQDYDIEHLTRFPEVNDLANHPFRSAGQHLIVDLGANIGASARFLEQKWPNAQIWCFEPSVRNVELLKRNASKNMKVFQAAVGGRDGFCTIENPSAKPDGFRVIDEVDIYGSNSIEMLSMPSIMQRISSACCKPFILKVDIEGAECEVFKNASDWLEDWPVIMVELHDWMLPGSASSASVLKAFSDFGRDVIIVGSTLISLSNREF